MSKNSTRRKRQQKRARQQKRQGRSGGTAKGKQPGSNSPAARTPPQDQQLFSVEQYTESLHIGPLPAPETLAAYDNILPGAAERVIAMAERQAAHRQMLEKTVVKGGSRRANAGLVLGFLISLAFLAGSVFLIQAGHPVPGTALGTVDVVGLATVFVIGKREQRLERQDKARA